MCPERIDLAIVIGGRGLVLPNAWSELVGLLCGPRQADVDGPFCRPTPYGRSSELEFLADVAGLVMSMQLRCRGLALLRS